MASAVIGAKLKRLADGRAWVKYLLWSVDAIVMGVFWIVMRLVGPDKAVAAGNWIMSRMGPRTGKHQHIINNLSVAFPGLSANEIEELARASWGNLGSILAEYPHLGAIANEPGRLELIGDDAPRRFLERGESMIFITPHLGNWELAAAAGSRNGLSLSVVYSPQQNPILDRMLQYFRRPLGTRFLSGKGGARRILAEMDKGHSIGMLPDQRVNRGEVVPFFGREACTTTAPARLALTSGRPLFPIRIERLHGANFRLTVYDRVLPENPDASEREQVLQMTQHINQLMEGWIQDRPEQWLCAKRRWPRGDQVCNRRKEH